MSYDLLFFKAQQGQSLEETLENLRSIDLSEADPATLIDLRAVAHALLTADVELERMELDIEQMAESMSLTVEQFQKQFEFIGLSTSEESGAPVQISVERPMVVLSIPYWSYPPETVAAIKRHLDIILPTLASLGLTGYDAQTERELANTFFEPMIDAIHKIRELTIQKIREENPDAIL